MVIEYNDTFSIPTDDRNVLVFPKGIIMSINESLKIFDITFELPRYHQKCKNIIFFQSDK